MRSSTFYILLQINDALFPIGGYTQSYGLETYIQKNLISDEESAMIYIEQQLQNSFLYSELLPLRLAYEYAVEGNLDKIAELEEVVCASKSPTELRSASHRLGKRFLKAVHSLEMQMDLSLLDAYHERCGKTGISHAVVYGVLCACAHIEKEEALCAYLYAQTSGTVTNCVKLVPLSQTVGQRILYQCHRQFEGLVGEVNAMDETQLCSSSPGADIRSMQHEILYSRLYMS